MSFPEHTTAEMLTTQIERHVLESTACLDIQIRLFVDELKAMPNYDEHMKEIEQLQFALHETDMSLVDKINGHLTIDNMFVLLMDRMVSLNSLIDVLSQTDTRVFDAQITRMNVYSSNLISSGELAKINTCVEKLIRTRLTYRVLCKEYRKEWTICEEYSQMLINLSIMLDEQMENDKEIAMFGLA